MYYISTFRENVFELEPPVGGSVPYVKSLVLTGDNQGWPGLQRRDLQIYKYKTSFFFKCSRVAWSQETRPAKAEKI